MLFVFLTDASEGGSERTKPLATGSVDLLGLELRDLKNLGCDFGLTGFDDEELARLLAAEDATDGLCDEDAAPPAPQTPTSQLGDLRLLGRHRLLCRACWVPLNPRCL